MMLDPVTPYFCFICSKRSLMFFASIVHWSQTVHSLPPIVCFLGSPGSEIWIRGTAKLTKAFLALITFLGYLSSSFSLISSPWSSLSSFSCPCCCDCYCDGVCVYWPSCMISLAISIVCSAATTDVVVLSAAIILPAFSLAYSHVLGGREYVKARRDDSEYIKSMWPLLSSSFSNYWGLIAFGRFFKSSDSEIVSYSFGF